MDTPVVALLFFPPARDVVQNTHNFSSAHMVPSGKRASGTLKASNIDEDNRDRLVFVRPHWWAVGSGLLVLRAV